QASLSTFQKQAELWDKQGRSADLLVRDDVLREGERLARERPADLTDVDRNYLLASQAHVQAIEDREASKRQTRRWRYRFFFVLAGFLIFGAAGVAVWREDHLRQNLEQQYKEQTQALERELNQKKVDELEDKKAKLDAIVNQVTR